MDKNLNLQSKIELNDQVLIPILGLGVYQTNQGKETLNAVKWALETGYRHVDTAYIYGNESDVGKAILQSEIPRKDIFVTTKLWNSNQGYDKAKKALRTSLKDLKLEYVDLYLIHWPVENLRLESWRALVDMQKEGLCRSIGVSNFTVEHLKELFDYSHKYTSDKRPSVNQVEFSPFLYQKDLLEFCQSNGIHLEAYSPLTKGEKFSDPVVVKIAKKYSKTPAQILIRWCLELKVIVIPKSSHNERIRENANVFDFQILAEDMKQLNGLNSNYRTSWDPTKIP